MHLLQQQFSTPDPHFGPVPFWWWSADDVTAERIRWQMQKFRAGGLRNIGIIHLAPRGPAFGSRSDKPAYMSEEWWVLFEVALREAERLDMSLWFYDQIGFGGANQTARLVAENPDFAGYHLLRHPADQPLPADHSTLYEQDGTIYAIVRRGFDWLNKSACAALIDCVHGEFERRFPHDLGRTIAGTFQDELPPIPVWSPEVSERYEQRYGTPLAPLLPALFEDSADSRQIRRQVYEISAELTEAAFFQPLGAWHAAHDMLCGFDQSGPTRRGDPYGSQRFYHDYFRTMRHLNAPGSDMDGETKPHSSMAHLHGGKRVWFEAFHSSGWGGSIEETMHWLVPWLLDGATLYSPHSIYFDTRGGWWEWAPPSTGWRQPYFEHYGTFADAVSRICKLLSDGHHVCDVAIHYPAYAISGHINLSDVDAGDHIMRAANTDPDPDVTHMRDIYWALCGFRNRRMQDKRGALREAGIDFDIVDDLALQKATVDGANLHIAEETFSVLLLCGTTVMHPAARQTVERWIAAGGRVILIDALPDLPALEGVESADSAHSAAAMIPRRNFGAGEVLQRRSGDADVFLVAPDHHQLLPMHEPAHEDYCAPKSAEYRLKTTNIPHLFNPLDGSSTALPFERDGDHIRVTVPFDDWPSALVVALPAQASQPAPPPATTTLLDLSDNAWRILVDSTLDNRYGDFDLHGDARGMVPIERREVAVKTGDGDWQTLLWSEAAHWVTMRGEQFDLESAENVIYSTIFGNLSERDWMGRMGSVPRRFLHLGAAEAGETVWAQTHVIAPAAGRYYLLIESDQRFDGWVGNRPITWIPAPDRQMAWVDLQAGANQLRLRTVTERKAPVRAGVEISPAERPAMPVWMHVRHPNPDSTLTLTLTTDDVRSVRLIFAAKGRAMLAVNGTTLTEHGDFHPISRYGQEELDVTEWWQSAENTVRIDLPEGVGEAVIDGIIETVSGETITFSSGADWRDETGEPAVVVFGAEGLWMFGSDAENLCITPRPHPLPDVGWLTPGETPDPAPLPMVADVGEIGRIVTLRFPLPVGATTMRVQTVGTTRAWIGESEYPVIDGTVRFPRQAAGTQVTLTVEPTGAYTAAAVLRAPIRFDTAPTDGALGDWRTALQLPHFSGAVEYETTFTSGDWTNVTLDLGHVRGTVAAWLDGEQKGVRVWRPYRIPLGDLAAGEHRLRLRVTNTLGAHFEIGRPTSMVGSHPGFSSTPNAPFAERHKRSAAGGLFGPIRLKT